MERETFYYDATADINMAMDIDTCMVVNLPIELSNFTAEKEGSNSMLEWQTVTELHSDYFDIERSPDAEKWETIGKVSAAGDSQAARNYQFRDVAPFSGTNYYRLKQVDINGSFEYSHVEVVKFEGRITDDVLVYPNPVDEAIYIEYSLDYNTNIQVELFNVTGKKVFSETYNSAKNNWQIKTDGFPSGTYFLHINSPTGTITRKMIKG